MKDRRAHPDGTEWLPGTTDPYFENPYFIAYEYRNTTNRNRLTGGLTLKYHLLDWLYIQGQVSRDGYLLDVTEVVPSGVEYTRADGLHGGNLTQYEVNFHELNSSFMIGVNKKFGEKWSLAVNAGGNQQDNVSTVNGVGAPAVKRGRLGGAGILRFDPVDALSVVVLVVALIDDPVDGKVVVHLHTEPMRLRSRLGRDEDGSIATAVAIEGGCRNAFENSDGFDIVGVDIGQPVAHGPPRPT